MVVRTSGACGALLQLLDLFRTGLQMATRFTTLLQWSNIWPTDGQPCLSLSAASLGTFAAMLWHTAIAGGNDICGHACYNHLNGIFAYSGGF